MILIYNNTKTFPSGSFIPDLNTHTRVWYCLPDSKHTVPYYRIQVRWLGRGSIPGALATIEYVDDVTACTIKGPTKECLNMLKSSILPSVGTFIKNHKEETEQENQTIADQALNACDWDLV